jgi:hypothetical protein
VRDLLTEPGLVHVGAWGRTMRKALGDEVRLALDRGPGWRVPDAIRLATAVEGFPPRWLESLVTGAWARRQTKRGGGVAAPPSFDRVALPRRRPP